MEEEKKVTKWVCDICGYIYEGEEVPDDYVCPLCGADKSHFVKVEENE